MFEMAKGKYNYIYTQINAFIVQKAQSEVFYLLDILMYLEFRFKIDTLLSILLCI